MSVIKGFAKSGFWDYQNIIVPCVLAIPLAVEGSALAKNIYHGIGCLQGKIVSLKDTAVSSFTAHEGELTQQSIKRISKNISIAFCCLALMGGVIYSSVVFLPPAFGISVAITSAHLIGKMFLNAKSYKSEFVKAFTSKPGESQEVAKKRIARNIIKVSLITLGAIASIGIGSHIIIPMIRDGFSWSVSLPFQTRLVVFLEYIALSFLHLAIAMYKLSTRKKAEAVFHLSIAALAIVFPCFYLHNEMRLHHSYYGILLMALPFRAAKFFGGVVTFDSLLYMIEPLRGYWGVKNNQDYFYKYDFINSVVDNIALFFNCYNTALISQDINDGVSADQLLGIETTVLP